MNYKRLLLDSGYALWWVPLGRCSEFRCPTHRYRLTVSVATLKHSCLQTRISEHSALVFFVDALYKSTFTYLLTYFRCFMRLHWRFALSDPNRGQK